MNTQHQEKQTLEAVLIRLIRSCRRLAKDRGELWYGRELSWSQLSALSRLEQEGPMTIAALARAEGIKPQSMGSALAALAKADLLTRMPDPEDGRQILFTLTPKGLALRQSGKMLKQEWLDRLMEALSAQERHTLEEAAAIINRLEQV